MLGRDRLKVITTSAIVAMMCLSGLVTYAKYQAPSLESSVDGAGMQPAQHRLSQHQLIIQLFQQHLQQQSEILNELRAVKSQLAEIQSTKHQDVTALDTQSFPMSSNDQKLRSLNKPQTDSELEQREITQFLSLRNSIMREEKDMGWAPKMEATLTQLPTNLKAMRLDHTKIIYQDCRTSACVVEFMHSKAYDTTLFSASIEVAGIESVVFRDFEDHGKTKTIAVFKR